MIEQGPRNENQETAASKEFVDYFCCDSFQEIISSLGLESSFNELHDAYLKERELSTEMKKDSILRREEAKQANTKFRDKESEFYKMIDNVVSDGGLSSYGGNIIRKEAGLALRHISDLYKKG